MTKSAHVPPHLSSRLIDGAASAKNLRKELSAQIVAQKLTPGLAVIIVGDDPGSQIYVRNKARAAEEVGITSWTHNLPQAASQKDLLDLVTVLNQDNSVHGILVQMPLPDHINPQIVIAAIDPSKDVDGFHPVNVGRLALGLPCMVPCTPQACMILLREVVSDLAGKNALMIGCSNIVGKPMATLLLQAHTTVTIAHSLTKDLPELCRAADIMVVAIGCPEFIKGHWIKPEAVAIDVGINRIPDPVTPDKTKIVGDIEFSAALHRVSAITPVPGGVGPMTIACLLKNTVQAAEALI